jgi:Flp pilus assembly pilin Flp
LVNYRVFRLDFEKAFMNGEAYSAPDRRATNSEADRDMARENRMAKATSHFLRLTQAFASADRGAVAIEYGILLMMVAIALLGMASLSNVANSMSNTFNEVSSMLRSE